MHITILQGAFLPVPAVQGGACEKIWHRMGLEFAGMNHEVVHISRAYPTLPDSESTAGVQYRRVGGYDTPASLIKLKWLDLIYSIRAIRLIDKNTDVIVTNTFWSPFLLRGKQRKKVYVSVERVPKGQMRFYVHAGTLRGCSPAICEAIEKEIPAQFKHLVSYVPNPVPFEIRKADGNGKKNTILFVGRLHPEKGIHVLIESFLKLFGRGKKAWQLVIIGPYAHKDGGGGEGYLATLKELAEGGNITILDPIFDTALLTSYYADAKLFCYPAQAGSGDAAPVAPREAMAYGCVPVVSTLACFSDFIEHGKNGIAYDHTAQNQVDSLAKALAVLVKNESYREQLAREAINVSQSFSPTVVANRFIEDFQRMSRAV